MATTQETGLQVAAKARIEQSLASAIRAGQFLPGQRMPSGVQLARKHGVSPGTVHAALWELQRAGLVKRRKGDGTYVCPQSSESIIIRICHSSAHQIKTQHILGKLREAACESTNNVLIQAKPYRKEYIQWDVRRTAVDQFSGAEPATIQEIPVTSLPWLAQMGFCEDLTDRFEQWSQKANIYPVAIDAVRCDDRIYGMTFHSTLTGLTYDKRAFVEIGQDPEEMAGSLEKFVEGLEKFSEKKQFRSCFFGGNTRSFVMHLLRAYYDNLTDRLVPHDALPIEREVGLPILKLLQHIKWDLGAMLASPGEQGFKTWQEAYESLQTGSIPLLFGDLNSRLVYMTTPGAPEQRWPDSHIGFQVYAWGKDAKPFSMFNSFAWIVNPRVEQGARDFCWIFLQDYISPQSEYELDMRYLEQGMIHHRTDAFINGGKRVPSQVQREDLRKELFECAEPEVPDNVPMFDRFLGAAYRVLLDKSADPAKEYEYYRTTAVQDLDLGPRWPDDGLRG